MPKLKEDLFAVPEGEIYPKMFYAGQEATGVEEAARKRGILCDDVPEKRAPKRKAMKAPENKAAK